ncbi:MAG: pilin [Woeseiaceae bacterium]|nr:pilin [Woeseiaceae bacterium]
MKNSQQGFTLIELMIVVAIIGILASVALPAYQSYSVRAQVSEGLNLTGPLQAAITEYYNDYGQFPADNSAAGVGAANDYTGNYVTGITISGDTIAIQYGNDANAQIAGETVLVTAAANQGSLRWSCTSGGAISDTLLPQVCR